MPVMKNLRDNFQEVVDDCAEGGVNYLVCSSTPIDTISKGVILVYRLRKVRQSKLPDLYFFIHEGTG